MTEQSVDSTHPVYTLAKATDLKAVYYEGKVTVTASVEKVTTCAQFALQKEPFLIFPPRYRIVTFEKKKPGELCGQIVLTVPFTGELPFQSPPAFLNIQTSDGMHHVPVAIGEGPPQVTAAVSETTLSSSGLGVATGYSDTFDLAEALQDALKNLPASPNDPIDMLHHYQVETIGVELGGIVGFHRMYVVITGA